MIVGSHVQTMHMGTYFRKLRDISLRVVDKGPARKLIPLILLETGSRKGTEVGKLRV